MSARKQRKRRLFANWIKAWRTRWRHAEKSQQLLDIEIFTALGGQVPMRTCKYMGATVFFEGPK